MKNVFQSKMTALILVLFSASSYEAYAEADSLKTLSDMFIKADSVFKSRDYAGSRVIYLKIADSAEKNSDTSSLIEAYSMIARTYLILDQEDIGRKWIDKAEKLAKSDKPLGWSRYLGVRGRFEWQDQHNDRASATFKEMYQFCSEHKLYERAIDAAHMVAIVGTPEEQIEWGLKGIAEAEAGNITGWLGPLWNNLGATYEDQKKYDQALKAYLKARDYHYQYGDDRNKMIADWAVGRAYRLTGDFKDAEKWMSPVLDWSIKLDDTEFIGWSHYEMGEIALHRDSLISALSHLDLASNFLEKADMPKWDPDGFRELQKKIQEAKDKLTAANN